MCVGVEGQLENQTHIQDNKHPPIALGWATSNHICLIKLTSSTSSLLIPSCMYVEVELNAAL